MRLIITVALVFCAVACNKEEIQNIAVKQPSFITSSITSSGDSTCGLPFFGCVYGLKLIGSSFERNGDMTTLKLYLKHIPILDTVPMRWMASEDQFVKIIYEKELMSYSFMGKPSGEDSIKLNQLLSHND